MTVYVTFDIRSVPDPSKAAGTGHHGTRDADFASLRVSGDKHTILEQEVTPEKLDYWKRTPHLAHIPAAYTAWKQGLDEPVNGLSIRDWPAISPAQVNQALPLGIRTVEDFANLSDEGLRAFGIGGQQLKQKAKTYLESASGHGKVAEQMAAMQAQMKAMQDQMAQQAREKDEALAALAATQKQTKKPGKPEAA